MSFTVILWCYSYTHDINAEKIADVRILLWYWIYSSAWNVSQFWIFIRFKQASESASLHAFCKQRCSEKFFEIHLSWSLIYLMKFKKISSLKNRHRHRYIAVKFSQMYYGASLCAILKNAGFHLVTVLSV